MGSAQLSGPQRKRCLLHAQWLRTPLTSELISALFPRYQHITLACLCSFPPFSRTGFLLHSGFHDRNCEAICLHSCVLTKPCHFLHPPHPPALQFFHSFIRKFVTLGTPTYNLSCFLGAFFFFSEVGRTVWRVKAQQPSFLMSWSELASWRASIWNSTRSPARCCPSVCGTAETPPLTHLIHRF